MTFEEKKYYAGVAGEITGVILVNSLWVVALRWGWDVSWGVCIAVFLMMAIFDVKISFRRWGKPSPQETASD